MIIFNEGQQGRKTCSWAPWAALHLPVVGVSFATGAALQAAAMAGAVIADVTTSTENDGRETSNIIATPKRGDAARGRDRRRAPRLRDRGPRHQRQRLRHATILEIAEEMAS